MEIIVPSSPPSMEFDFGSGRSTPYILTAPSTPRRFGEGDNYYFSAPTSPSRMAEFYKDFDVFEKDSGGPSSSSDIPFGWEEKPEKPENSKSGMEDEEEEEEEEDFAFDLGPGLEGAKPLSAEELFVGGKIRPMKPAEVPGRKNEPVRERGRARTTGPGSGSRSARSLSPYRVSAYQWEEDEKQQQPNKLNNPLGSSSKGSGSGPVSRSGSGSGLKKWWHMDFFLFRSASEGRATDKDPLRKYTTSFSKRQDQEIRNSGSGSGSGSGSRRRPGQASAHEVHYTINKAASEDLKKRKTFLPYKQGILGRLAFNPAIHALANGFGSRNH